MSANSILDIPQTRVALLFSGGLDSTGALALLRADGHEVMLIEVEHAQRPAGERDAAAAVAAHFRSQRVIVRMNLETMSDSAPRRPSALLLFSIADHAARAHGVRDVVFATVLEDVALHREPEAGDYYFGTVKRLLSLHSLQSTRLHAPFRGWPKAQLAAEAARVGAPLHLAWSCVAADVKRCGSCVPCAEAMAAADAALGRADS